MKPLEGPSSESTEWVVEDEKEVDEDDDEGLENDEDDEDENEGTYEYDGRTFEEVMEADINLITEFVKGLRYQVQFRDQQMLTALQREGASFFWLAKACVEKERSGTVTVSTDKSTSSAKFYRTRPNRVDQGT